MDKDLARGARQSILISTTKKVRPKSLNPAVHTSLISSKLLREFLNWLQEDNHPHHGICNSDCEACAHVVLILLHRFLAQCNSMPLIPLQGHEILRFWELHKHSLAPIFEENASYLDYWRSFLGFLSQLGPKKGLQEYRRAYLRPNYRDDGILQGPLPLRTSILEHATDDMLASSTKATTMSRGFCGIKRQVNDISTNEIRKAKTFQKQTSFRENSGMEMQTLKRRMPRPSQGQDIAPRFFQPCRSPPNRYPPPNCPGAMAILLPPRGNDSVLRSTATRSALFLARPTASPLPSKQNIAEHSHDCAAKSSSKTQIQGDSHSPGMEKLEDRNTERMELQETCRRSDVDIVAHVLLSMAASSPPNRTS